MSIYKMNRVYSIRVDPVPCLKNLKYLSLLHPKFSHIFDAVAFLKNSYVFHMTKKNIPYLPALVKSIYIISTGSTSVLMVSPALRLFGCTFFRAVTSVLRLADLRMMFLKNCPRSLPLKLGVGP